MRNLLTVARFEIARLLLTRRGLVSIVAFLLVWFLVLRHAIFPASRLLAGYGDSPLLRYILDRVNLEQLADWLVPELTVYWVFSLFLLPFFCILLTADQTASDRARGTLRFLHLRATRAEIFFGRFSGQMLIQFLLILVTILTTFALAVYRDQSVFADGLTHFSVIVVNLFIVLLPYTALMAMVSIVAKSARQATTYAMILYAVIYVLKSYLLVKFPALFLLKWVLPGSQLTPLMQLQTWDTLSLAPIPLVQTLVLLFVGWLIVRRIDL